MQHNGSIGDERNQILKQFYFHFSLENYFICTILIIKIIKTNKNKNGLRRETKKSIYKLINTMFNIYTHTHIQTKQNKTKQLYTNLVN